MIEECRAPRISMQPGLLEFEHFLVFSSYCKHCHHCNEFSRIEMHCWIEMQSVLLEFQQIVALHRITDIWRPPYINAFSGIASCCVALWNTQPGAFFSIVNRSSGILRRCSRLHCIEVEHSYLATQHLLGWQQAQWCWTRRLTRRSTWCWTSSSSSTFPP